MLTMIPHLEQTMGTFYPRGGMISITNAVYKLALKMGVTFHFNTEVTAIRSHGGAVTGIVADDKERAFNTIVSNMDVYYRSPASAKQHTFTKGNPTGTQQQCHYILLGNKQGVSGTAPAQHIFYRKLSGRVQAYFYR